MLSIDFALRFVILNSGVLLLLRGLYFRSTPNRETIFSYYLFSNSIFLVCYLLAHLDLSMGFAFGLFAIFAMLRYRTEAMSLRDMTYLFVVVTLSLISAVAKISYLQLGAVQLLVLSLALLCEFPTLLPRISEKKIVYDKLELTKPENRAMLFADLQARSGMQIKRVSVDRIDFLTDSAQLTIYAEEPKMGDPSNASKP